MTKELTLFPPWKIKMVEPIPFLSREEREEAIKRAGYNTFNLRSDEVTIDLLSDSGTNALSTIQYADSILAPEAVNSKAFHDLLAAVRDTYKKEFVLTFHQGRAAERLLFEELTRDKKHIVGNSYFLTTLEFAKYMHLEWHDLITPEAYKTDSLHPFKGNMDLLALDLLIRQVKPEDIAFVRMESNVNILGGQPFSLENIKELRRFADKWGLLLVLDATLLSENAFFIWEREFNSDPGLSPPEITRMVTKFFDVVYVSSKRDHIAPSGGIIMTNDQKLHSRLKELGELFEGIGIAARDMAIIAQGIRESMDARYLETRIRQVQNFAYRLIYLGLPVCTPTGGHAVHLDAQKFLPHVSPDAFPAQTLAATYYIVSGVRSMEIGSVALSIDYYAQKREYPRLEMLRLAIPRRVYTTEHLEYAALSLKQTWNERNQIRGLKMVYDPGILRSFKAKFAPY